MKTVLVDSRGLPWTEQVEMYKRAGHELVLGNVTTDEEFIEKCHDADALLILIRPVGAELIDKLEKCKVIVRCGIGYDNIDVEACNKKGIAVANVPDASTEEVAAQALALALCCVREIVFNDRKIRRGEPCDQKGLNVPRLSSMTYGIIGFGRIARKMSSMAKVFCREVIAYDPFVDDAAFAAADVRRCNLDELLGEADIVVVQVPMTPETYHMIDADKFSKMKKGVVFVNTARGEVVDEEALCDAIDEGIVVSAGLDVVENEPAHLHPEARIRKYDNVILSGHCGAASKEAWAKIMDVFFSTPVKVFNEDGLPYNIVNKNALK